MHAIEKQEQEFNHSSVLKTKLRHALKIIVYCLKKPVRIASIMQIALRQSASSKMYI